MQTLGETEEYEFGEEPFQQVTPEEHNAEIMKIQEQRAKPRRGSVSAARVSNEQVYHYRKPVHPKDDVTKERLLQMIQGNDKLQVILGHLGRGPLMDVVNAFYTREYHPGTDIICQGGEGDCLYIIADGQVDIFVNRPGPDGYYPPGRGTMVVTFGVGALFGELALMYNSPRAATVTAASGVVCWVLDAMDFKMLLVQSSQAQYAKYEGWLSEVDLLRTLNHFELAKLADVLQSDCYDPGEDIIRQGEVGDKFFILEDGSAAAFIWGDGGERCVKLYERMGDYFGEIALLTNETRRATVRATGEGASAVYLSKQDFTNVLGPIADILAKHVDEYPHYAQFLASA